MRIASIVSGGQAGADRAGLDAAISSGVPHGGWVPRGRRSEDGTVPEKYALKETGAPGYLVRTRLNATISDATVVFTHGTQRSGSARTIEIAASLGKPCLHVDLDGQGDHIAAVLGWLEGLPQGRGVLNVAGSRESSWPGIGDEVRRIMLVVIERGTKA